jgi:transposase
MKMSLLAIDLAKNVFQLHGVDERGHPLLRKQVSRAKLLEVVQNLPPCRIVMEACGGSNYWARRFQALGHRVQLIAAQFVKPFVKSHKNDRHDAEAIAEAAARPTMRYVPVKTVEQQDIQTLHRIRSLLMKDRIAQINQIRGLLAEYGIVIPQSAARVRQQLPWILEDAANELTPLTRPLMADLYERLVALDERIARYDHYIQQVHRNCPLSRKLEQIRGVGPLIATAVLASVGDAKAFKNGRPFAAWLGVVPRQQSSGGKPRLLGITKRGDKYLRTLLVHGARAVVSQAPRREDRLSGWITRLRERRGMNVAVVALANKTARVIWALLAKGEDYQPAL